MVKKPLIILLLQGLGLNPSSAGNAFYCASPSNFLQIWKDFEHYMVKPLPAKSAVSDYSFYQSFFSKESIGTPHNIVTDLLSSPDTIDKSELQTLFNYVKKNSSKLHHFFTISSSSHFGDEKHLIASIKAAKTSKVYRQQVHILIDDNSSNKEIMSILSALQAKLEKLGTPITTIHKHSDLWSRGGISLLRDTVITGKGKRILSLKQLSLNDDGVGYIATKDSDFVVSDFDGVLFDDFDISAISPLLSYFVSFDNAYSVKGLRYLKPVCYFSSDKKFTKQSIIKSKNEFWLDLKGKEKGSIIADVKVLSRLGLDTTRDGMKPFSLDDPVIAKLSIAKKLDKIRLLIEAKLRKKEESIIIIDLPFIFDACKSGKFADISQNIKTIDAFLKSLVSCIISSDGILLVTSLFGMAEDHRMVCLPFGDYPEFSTNPLPLIIVSNESRAERQHSLQMADFLGRKESYNFIQKTVLKYLNN